MVTSDRLCTNHMTEGVTMATTKKEVIKTLQQKADTILRNISLEEQREIWLGHVPHGWPPDNPKIRRIHRMRRAIQRLSA